MSSERRIRASRINGALSRGPVTPEGKRNSSRNNLRHGIVACNIVLQNEEVEAFAILLSDLKEKFQPHSGAEPALVEDLAGSYWRLQHLWGVEKAMLAAEIAKHDSSSPATAIGHAFQYLSDHCRLINNLPRYESRLVRQYTRCQEILARRQTSKLPFEPSPIPEHPKLPSALNLRRPGAGGICDAAP